MKADPPCIELTAPAKINLSLRVLRRRDDGFHEIETRMVPIPHVADKVRIELTPDAPLGALRLECDSQDVPADESNLAAKAVRELARAQGQELPALSVAILKNIPSGAGMGGGSSDAAAVLKGVNTLLNLGLNRDELARIGARIGSDVPFFVFDSACDCSGRGETVVPLPESEVPTLPPVILVKPPFCVETPGAYRRWLDSREIPGVLYSPQTTQAGVIVNDLERPVFEKFPFLAELKMWLIRRPEVSAALMSGSGATVFAFLSDDCDGILEDDVRKHFGADMWIARSPCFTL